MTQDTLKKAQAISSIISAVAIPLAIAVVGWWVQSSMKSEEIKIDYVQMAVGILKDQERKKDDDLRKWAVSVLDKNSPVPFSGALRERLESGEAQISFYFPTPPAILMEPPKSLKPLTEDGAVTNGDLIASIADNYHICRENALILEHLQLWTADMKNISLGQDPTSP